ncbi:39S ribosomal protein L41, mitochondrial [Chamberlinius hualienensis]
MASYVGNVWLQFCRSFSTTQSLNGKKNFRKFLLYNKRGSWEHRRLPQEKKIFYDLGVRKTGAKTGFRYHHIDKMIPEIIVPDLTGFKLKPYVSYRVPDVIQSEFTSQDLFNACYAPQLIEDFKHNRLDESKSLGLSPEEAWTKARQTGSDMFYEKLDIKMPLEYKKINYN